MNRVNRFTARWRKAALIVTGLFLAYSVAGFVLLPWLIHDTVTRAIADATHRPVTLAELKINPLKLSATLRGLEIGTATQPLAGFDEIHVNFSSSSLWRGAYVFNAIRLQQPRLVIAIDHEGRFNFQDLMAADDAAAEVPATPAPVVVIESLEVLRAAIDFDDRSRAEPFKTTIATLDFSLRDFTTRRDESGNYTLHVATDLDEQFDWQGSLQATPFRSEGELKLTALRVETIWGLAGAGFKFDLERGLVDVDAHYSIDLSGAEPEFQLNGVKLALRDLQLLRRGSREPVMEVPRLDLAGLDFDLSRRTVSIADVTLAELTLAAVRQANGEIDLQRLFSKDPENEPEESEPWQIKVTSLQLQQASFNVVDQTTRPAAQWQLSPFNLALKGIELESDKPIAVTLDSGINGSGSAALSGELRLSPLSTTLDLKLNGLDLSKTQPYLQQVAQLQLQKGVLDVEGRLHFEMGEPEPLINFNGALAVREFHAVDMLRGEDFLRWKALAVKELKYESRESHLGITELALTDPYLRFIIATDASTNLSHILAVPGSGTTPAEVKPAAKEASAAPLINIKRVSVANGLLNFSDQSIKPGFSINIEQLNGAIRGLSSRELARADVDLKGKVDRYAPATITGKVNPLSDDAFTDLKFDFRGIEMASFSPYTGKFAGYRIDKGKLNVELRYLLSQKQLQGENKIIIDQLQLGEAVESPDAVGLPIRLAIAILKDSNGVIDLDLPVSGRIDDPDFHYGTVVWMALKNVIVKVATAPFRALASLLGGSEESANQVGFEPGSAMLGSDEQTKLAALARALSQREALVLEVRGTASSADVAAIAALLLEQELLPLPGTTRQQKIVALYHKRHGVAATTLLPPLAKDEKRSAEQTLVLAADAAEKKLLQERVVSEDELRILAQQRAQAIVAALTVGEAGIGAERIFLLDTDIKGGPGALVVVPLSLRAR